MQETKTDSSHEAQIQSCLCKTRASANHSLKFLESLPGLMHWQRVQTRLPAAAFHLVHSLLGGNRADATFISGRPGRSLPQLWCHRSLTCLPSA